MIEKKIRDALSGILRQKAFEKCFLVELILHPNNKLEVFIDCEGGVTFDKCRKVSRALEAILDKELWLGERYVLEVSSPGVGRPLKHKRQYALNLGRKLCLKLQDGRELSGRLEAVDEETLTLLPLPSKTRKKGKPGPKRQTELVVVPLEAVLSAKVEVEF